jgi:hypothetical protein
MSRLPVLLLLAVLVVGVSVDAHSHRSGAHVDGHEKLPLLADMSEETINEGEDEHTEEGGARDAQGREPTLDPMQEKAVIEIKALTKL